eukprot:jgi/Picsp_1/4221/NSC_01730-R1_---NA---
MHLKEDRSTHYKWTRSLLEIPGVSDTLLAHFHSKRLEDIQGVGSLWSVGLLKDEEKVRRHFLNGRRGRYGELLSPDVDIEDQRDMVRYAMALDSRAAVDDLSRDDWWNRYQFLSVIPSLWTCLFVVKMLKCRKEVKDIMSRGVNQVTEKESGKCLQSALTCAIPMWM